MALPRAPQQHQLATLRMQPVGWTFGPGRQVMLAVAPYGNGSSLSQSQWKARLPGSIALANYLLPSWRSTVASLENLKLIFRTWTLGPPVGQLAAGCGVILVLTRRYSPTDESVQWAGRKELEAPTHCLVLLGERLVQVRSWLEPWFSTEPETEPC